VASSLRLHRSSSTAASDYAPSAVVDNLGGRITLDEYDPFNGMYRLLIPKMNVLVRNAYNGIGRGKLTLRPFGMANNFMRWQAPRDSEAGAEVNVVGDPPLTGIVLPSVTPEAELLVELLTGFIWPPVATTYNVEVPKPKNALFPDVTVAQAMAGHVDYRCVFLRNISVDPINTIRPVFRTMTAELTAEYSAFGNATLKLSDARNFPECHYIRNRRTAEILYYSGRTAINSLTVMSTSRGLRDTSGAFGAVGDTLELVPCFDISVEQYDPATGAGKIAEGTMPPSIPNAVFPFACPDSLDDPQFKIIPWNMNPDAITTVWFRRNIPAGAIQFAANLLTVDFIGEPVGS